MSTAKSPANEFYGRPADGLTIRDPQRGFQPVPAEARTYPESDYWVRRFGCGDMVEVSRPAATAAKPDKPFKSKISE
tara:strand:+ start:150 stop:380 length:231 start_codon:yes stop_codon:yes gene_type:complete